MPPPKEEAVVDKADDSPPRTRTPPQDRLTGLTRNTCGEHQDTQRNTATPPSGVTEKRLQPSEPSHPHRERKIETSTTTPDRRNLTSTPPRFSGVPRETTPDLEPRWRKPPEHRERKQEEGGRGEARKKRAATGGGGPEPRRPPTIQRDLQLGFSFF
ncbi:hypothetical protein IGI04_026914 [Brassica rapa subsp. trilocularis]|uniref:Uncharacterized protein n=1 Tax=Brassica rapa subsp. trilocularis TaxID=1813537 RepID=A0ABQ7KXG2_BRACM|nr:hypothetical protein IGI04_026914 [Brassica rapa subsp. trilocularis]